MDNAQLVSLTSLCSVNVRCLPKADMPARRGRLALMPFPTANNSFGPEKSGHWASVDGAGVALKRLCHDAGHGLKASGRLARFRDQARATLGVGMSRTLLALMVPEAEPVVGSFRDQYDPSARRGLGAHITLIYPFLDSQWLSPQVLARLRDVIAGVPAPMFRLIEVRTFPSVVWLAPEPAKHIMVLADALVAAFPDHPKGGGAFPDFVPHLTAARGVHHEKEAVVNELGVRLADYGPVYCWCENVTLLVSEDRRWRVLAQFPLLH